MKINEANKPTILDEMELDTEPEQLIRKRYNFHIGEDKNGNQCWADVVAKITRENKTSVVYVYLESVQSVIDGDEIELSSAMESMLLKLAKRYITEDYIENIAHKKKQQEQKTDNSQHPQANAFCVMRDCLSILQEEIAWQIKQGNMEKLSEERAEELARNLAPVLMQKFEKLLDDHQPGLVADVINDVLQ